LVRRVLREFVEFVQRQQRRLVAAAAPSIDERVPPDPDAAHVLDYFGRRESDAVSA